MVLPPPRTPATEPTLTTRPCPLASSNGWQARTIAKGPRRFTASTMSRKSSSRARRSACGDYARAAGIVDQDVEPALGGTDRGGEAFDGARILRRRAARAVVGTGQAGNQPGGRL